MVKCQSSGGTRLISRRNFLKTSAAATGAVAVSATEALAQSQSERALPAPIAALQSMRAQAKPITGAERQGRIEKARKLMAQHKLDAVLLTGGTSMVYFSNIRWGLSERMFAMVLPVKGDPFFVSPAFEEDRAIEQITSENSPWSSNTAASKPDVRVWQEDESPWQRTAQGLKDRSLVGLVRFGWSMAAACAIRRPARLSTSRRRR